MAISKHWTGGNDNKVGVPESDDYTKWSTGQIRRDCTSRKMLVKKGTNKESRIALLREYDSLKELEAASSAVKVPPPRSPTRSRSCIYRLLNILFDDEFCDDFGMLGNSYSRRDLDELKSSEQRFWDRVTEAFKKKGMYDVLLGTDELFGNFDGSKIIPHTSTKLESMWKGVKGKYKMAMCKFTKSGTHESDFKPFCDGNGGALYLHMCLELNNGLINFVQEGFLDKDKFDSLEPD